MRTSLKDVLRRLDLSGYEAATEQRCPVCGTESALSIRGSESVACRHCAFVGDVIHLYAAAKRLTLALALTDLKYHGCVDFQDSFEESIYVSDSEMQAKLQKVWAKASADLANVSSTSRTILAEHRCWFDFPVTKQIARHHGYFQLVIFDEHDIDLPKEAHEAKQWLRGYGAIVIPVYSAWRIVGFWMIRSRRSDDEGATPAEFYLPLVNSEAPGVGFAHSIPIGTPEVFVVDSAITAMRYNARQIFDGHLETPFVVPQPGHRVELTCLGESEPIFFTSSLDPRWFSRATEVPAARSVVYSSYQDLGFQPTASLCTKPTRALASRSAIASLRNRARPAHEAYARFLLSKKPMEAKRIFASHPLSPVGQSRCVQAVGSEEAAELSRIFERTSAVRVVDIDGRTVVERLEGWFCGGALVTDTTFQITEIIVEAGETRARGSVRFKNAAIPFECPYEDIRRNTRSWLEDIVLKQPGRGLPVITPAWGPRLLRIATGFQEPHRVVRGTVYGWGDDGRALFMPYFVIRPDGILGTETAGAQGPRIAKPNPLTSDEWGIVQDPSACQLLLALLGNALRTQARLPGVGIAVRTAPHVVESVAAALKLPVQHDLRPDRLERCALDPLPVPVTWTDDALAEAFGSGAPMNVLMSVDPGSHRLLKLHRNWLCLDIQEYSWGDALRFVFLMVREILWTQGPEPIHLEAEHLYADLAKRLHLILGARGIASDCFTEAAREMGRSISHTGNAAFTLLLTLHWAQERGTLHPVVRDGLVVLQVQEIRAALANPFTPKTDLEMMARQLVAARFMAADRAGEWHLVKDVWESAASLYASK